MIVVNPGTHPEPAHLAAGLSKTGVQVEYWTSSSWSEDSALMRFAGSGLGHRLPLTALSRSRILPQTLKTQNVRHMAVVNELWFQLMRRHQPERAPQALAQRSKRFSKKAALRMKRTADIDCVIAQQTAALDVFEAAPTKATRVLTYPIAHHRWMTNYLGKEAKENPDWAAFLQGHDRSETELQRLDREIDLASHIVVPSHFVRSTFIQQGVDPKRLHVQFLAATPEELDSEGAPLEWTRSGLRVLFVGQVNQRKGLSYLLDGFRRAHLPEAELTLVGPAAKGIEQKLPDDGSVRLLGPRPHATLGSIYRSADVFVFPSLAEGFALTAIEAMACGLPCIISTNTLGGGVISDDSEAIVVPPRDAGALARALQRLADDPELRFTIGERAARRATHFTWSSYQQAAADLVIGLL